MKDLIEEQISKQSENSSAAKKMYLENINKINNFDNERTKLVKAELDKTQKAIIHLCELIDEKNKSGAIDKIKTLFS